MATRSGRRSRKLSDGDYEEASAAPTSTRPPSNRRAQAAEEIVDTLTPEERYLLQVFRRFRKLTPPSSHESTNIKRPTSPIPSNGVGGKKPLASAAAKEKPGAGGAGGGLGGVSETGKASKTKEPSPPRPAVPQPTDTASRLKMLLEKKRKEATGPRAGSAAAASGASIQRKAKINKVSGAPSSSTGAKLDSVKVHVIAYRYTALILTCFRVWFLE